MRLPENVDYLGDEKETAKTPFAVSLMAKGVGLMTYYM
jgi:hypothetical protein